MGKLIRRLPCVFVGLSTFLLVAHAEAQAAHIGEDGRCVYVVPNHSTVYTDSGDVYAKDGTFLGNNVTACAALAESGSTTSTSPGVSEDGPDYPTYVDAYALHTGGWNNRYNYMDSQWFVPTGPDNRSHVGSLVFWNGLEGFVYGGACTTDAQCSSNTPSCDPGGTCEGWRLIQPILKWESPGSTPMCPPPAGWGAYIFAEYAFTGAAGDVQTCPIAVSLYDWIEGTMAMIDDNSGGDGDEWLIQVQDNSNSEIEPQQLDVRTGSANPAMQYALLGVQEVHSLTACDGLSTDSANYFYLNTLDQEGSSWYDFENVQDLVTVTSNWGGWSPSCSWGAGATWEGSYWLSDVTWAD